MLDTLDEIIYDITGENFLKGNEIILGQLTITEENYRGKKTLVADSFVKGFKTVTLEYPDKLNDFFSDIYIQFANFDENTNYLITDILVCIRDYDLVKH